MKENIYQNVPAGFHAQLMETLEQLPEGKKRGTARNTSVRRWLVPLAAVLALGTMTAAAAGIFKWKEAAKERFGVSEELEDKLTMDGVARQEDTVVKEAGMEFRLMQSVRTDRTMYYLCQVTPPDGIEIDGDTIFENCDYESNVELGGVICNFVSSSQDEEQYLLEVELRLLDGIDYAGQKVDVHLYNLVQTEKTEITDLLLEGEWKLPVMLSGEIDTVLYETDQQVEFGRHTLQVQKVEASPFQLKLYMDETESRHALEYYSAAVTGIRNMDGSWTEEEYYINQAACTDEVTGEFYYRVELDPAIDPAQLTGIAFNDGETELVLGTESAAERKESLNTGDTVRYSREDEWEEGEPPAGSKVVRERNGKAVVTDGKNLYLQDITCGKILPVLDLGTLSYDPEHGGEIVPFASGPVFILPYEGSEIIYAFEPTENNQGDSIHEMEAESMLSTSGYQIYREEMLKNQQE